MKSLSFLELPAATAALGSIFPGYRFHRLLAGDSAGSFFEATDAIAGKPLIFKIIEKPPARAACGWRESFTWNVATLTALSHPNLLRVFHGGEKDGVYYFVSEAPPGGTLEEAVEGIRIKEADAIRVVREICDGLSYAYQNVLPHGELRLSNIWLDADAHPKIGFTGLGRALSSLESSVEVGMRRHYAAPETRTRPEAADIRSDVYSVGVVLHRLLTGTVPDVDPRPASLIARCNPKLDEIIRKATDPLPDLRYPDAAALRADLENCGTSGVRPWSVPSPARVKQALSRPAPAPRHVSSPTPYRPALPVRKLVVRQAPVFTKRRSRSDRSLFWSAAVIAGLAGALIYLINRPGPALAFKVNAPPAEAVQKSD